jgi:hypothetical protein
VFNFSQKSTLLERQNMLAMVVDAFNDASIKAVIENIEPIY